MKKDDDASLLPADQSAQAKTEALPKISVEKLDGEWDGDPPSYVISDDREGVCLCICWLPDVAGRIKNALSGEEKVAIHRGEHLDRVSIDGRDHYFTKHGEYDGWGRCLVGASEFEVASALRQIGSGNKSSEAERAPSTARSEAP